MGLIASTAGHTGETRRPPALADHRKIHYQSKKNTIMFAVKFEMDGQNVKKTYSHEVFTDSRHKTREEAEKVVRGYYRDFMNDGPDGRTLIEGTDTDFTVITDNPAARITGTLHFYIEEED